MKVFLYMILYLLGIWGILGCIIFCLEGEYGIGILFLIATIALFYFLFFRDKTKTESISNKSADAEHLHTQYTSVRDTEYESSYLLSTIKELSKKEKAAIFFVAGGMMLIDGQRDPRELILMARVNMKLSIDDEIMQMSSALPKEDMLLIIKNMSYAKKVFVSQYILALMGIDGDMDIREMKLFSHLTIECDLPSDCVSEDSLKYFFDMVYKS